MEALAADVDLAATPTASPERVTFRAILLGLITIVVMVFYVTYFGWNLIKNYMPVAALLPLVAWVVINTGLKFVSPRHVLSRTEILTVFWVAWVASSLPATGWAGYIITNISAPVHFMSPENRVEEVVLPFLSRSFFLGPDPVVVGQIYTGLEQGLSIPWGAWFRPLFWWTAGCLSLVMAGFFCSVLFYKQWHEHERLTFPLAVFPMDLLETEEGSRVPDVFRTPVFWVGFTFAAGIVCWNVLGYFQHTLPRLTLFDNWQTKAVPISYHFPNYYLRVQPLIMGLAYPLPARSPVQLLVLQRASDRKDGAGQYDGIHCRTSGPTGKRYRDPSTRIPRRPRGARRMVRLGGSQTSARNRPRRLLPNAGAG